MEDTWILARSKLFGDGFSRSQEDESRRYNLLLATLVANLVKNSLGPCGLEKMYIDIMGEITVTKDGSAILRKLDVEHPASKNSDRSSQCGRQ